MKKFYGSLRGGLLRIINFKKNKVKLLTKEQQQSCKNAQLSYIRKK